MAKEGDKFTGERSPGTGFRQRSYHGARFHSNRPSKRDRWQGSSSQGPYQRYSKREESNDNRWRRSQSSESWKSSQGAWNWQSRDWDNGNTDNAPWREYVQQPSSNSAPASTHHSPAHLLDALRNDSRDLSRPRNRGSGSFRELFKRDFEWQNSVGSNPQDDTQAENESNSIPPWRAALPAQPGEDNDSNNSDESYATADENSSETLPAVDEEPEIRDVQQRAHAHRLNAENASSNEGPSAKKAASPSLATVGRTFGSALGASTVASALESVGRRAQKINGLGELALNQDPAIIMDKVVIQSDKFYYIYVAFFFGVLCGNHLATYCSRIRTAALCITRLFRFMVSQLTHFLICFRREFLPREPNFPIFRPGPKAPPRFLRDPWMDGKAASTATSDSMPSLLDSSSGPEQPQGRQHLRQNHHGSLHQLVRQSHSYEVEFLFQNLHQLKAISGEAVLQRQWKLIGRPVTTVTSCREQLV